MSEQEIYLAAINKFGSFEQQDRMIEEASEVIKAILKLRRVVGHNPINIDQCWDNLCEELADLEIMSAQMRLIFDSTKIDTHKQLKLNRLKKMVK